MSALPQSYLSPEEYLAIERESDYRSEYFAGEMFAMSGASETHNMISVNLIGELRAKLRRGPCQIFANDMRVRVSMTGLYTYPDIVVVCGDRLFDDSESDTLLNPKLIIEILSPSTEAYDRGRKFEHYASISSLEEYVLVAQDQPSIQLYQRIPDDSWRYVSYSGVDTTIEFPSISASLALADIYEGVTFA